MKCNEGFHGVSDVTRLFFKDKDKRMAYEKEKNHIED